jgi:predicted 3-demethylubiquinone-9 3-methyltransferase (glyoxalase superfamily)
MPKIQQKITPFLWFDTQAEEAAEFYTSIFENSLITRISRYGKVGREVHGKEAGSVLTVEFEIEGQTFIALNGGPHFKFNEAVSFQVTCETQDEIDYFWRKLSEGGQEGQCGWLKDKYGLSWQVVPSALPQMLTDADGAKSERVMKALLQMKKFNLQALERAYTGLAAATTEAMSVGDVASLTRRE